MEPGLPAVRTAVRLLRLAPNDGSSPAAGKVRTADKAVYGDGLAQALHLFPFVPTVSLPHSRLVCKIAEYSQLELPAGRGVPGKVTMRRCKTVNHLKQNSSAERESFGKVTIRRIRKSGRQKKNPEGRTIRVCDFMADRKSRACIWGRQRGTACCRPGSGDERHRMGRTAFVCPGMYCRSDLFPDYIPWAADTVP